MIVLNFVHYGRSGNSVFSLRLLFSYPSYCSRKAFRADVTSSGRPCAVLVRTNTPMFTRVRLLDERIHRTVSSHVCHHFRASTRESGLRTVMNFMLHSPDLGPVLAMQETILQALLSVLRRKGTESEVRVLLFWTRPHRR